MSWIGGKPAGTISEKKTGYQVLITHDGETCTKFFSNSASGSKKTALAKAKKWQYTESAKRGLVKNMIQEINDGEDTYIKVQLDNDFVMKCDAIDLDLVNGSIWTAWQSARGIWYARRRANKKLAQSYGCFHNLLEDDTNKIEHINGDGLDNRRDNLYKVGDLKAEQIEEEKSVSLIAKYWYGGKPGGTISEKINGYQVRFKKDGKVISKWFSVSEHGSKDKALEQAEDWQYRKSWKFGTVKNSYREVYDGEEKYLQVKLRNDVIMKCDIIDVNIVKSFLWTVWKNKKNDMYARCQTKNKMFHNMIFPEYKKVHHINGDSLDNRRINLNNASAPKPIITENVTGVYHKTGNKEAWRAQIGGGKNRKTASFSVNIYGYERAREMAITMRKRWEKELD